MRSVDGFGILPDEASSKATYTQRDYRIRYARGGAHLYDWKRGRGNRRDVFRDAGFGLETTRLAWSEWRGVKRICGSSAGGERERDGSLR